MRNFVCQILLFLVALTISIPATAQAPASPCGAQPFCVDTADFVAVITSFRTSLTNSNVKVIDTTIRFQNKTNQPLILGYAINSGMATDDRGNRLVVAGPNGYRGIGAVAGTNFEPKFMIRPGSYGDAQFELLAQGWPKLVGFTHNLDITVNEINSFEGNQHTIGGEFPLHFQGLANGSAGSPPAIGAMNAMGQAAATGPCGLAGAQGAGGKASTTVSGAASAISNLGSLFGKKKAVQNANQVSNVAAGCDPRVNDVASKAGLVAGMAASDPPTTTAAPQNMQAQMLQGASAAQPSTASAAAMAAPSTGNTPANLATDAFSRIRQKRQLKGTAQAQAQAGQPQSAASASSQLVASNSMGSEAPQNSTPPSVNTALQGAQLQDPGDPSPTLGAANKAATASKYDIVGIHLGMPAKDAAGIMHARNLQITPDTLKYAFLSAPLTYGLMGVNQVVLRNSGTQPNSEKVYVMLTMAPSQQVVSKVSRFLMFSKETAPTNDGLVSDLIKKYGQPSYDSHPPNLAARGYRELFWVDDASGHRLLNQSMGNGGYSEQINNCRSIATFSPSGASYQNDAAIEVDPVWVKGRLQEGYGYRLPVMYHCADLTIVYAKLLYGYPIGVSSPDVVGGLIVVVGSGPLDRQSTDATHEYLLQAAKAHDNQQKSAAQKNKPAL